MKPKYRLAAMTLFQIFALSISSASNGGETPAEESRTILEIYAEKCLPDNIQRTIFDYLEEPNYAIAFDYIKPDGSQAHIECVDCNIEEILAREKISHEDVVNVYGLNYNQCYHLSLTKIDSLAGSILQYNSPLEAFNPDHPGAWLEPSDAELLLDRCPKTGIDMETVQEKVIPSLKSLLDETRYSFKNILTSEPYKPLTHHQESLLAKIKHRIKRPPQFVEQKKPSQLPTHLDIVLPTLQPEIKNIILGYLQLEAKKQSMTLMTPCGPMLWEKHRRVTPWETVDCIGGVDAEQRRHLLIDQESAFKIPPHFSTVCIIAQGELQRIANDPPDMPFLVPGPEEIALKKPIQKSALRQLQTLAAKTKLKVFSKHTPS